MVHVSEIFIYQWVHIVCEGHCITDFSFWM